MANDIITTCNRWWMVCDVAAAALRCSWYMAAGLSPETIKWTEKRRVFSVWMGWGDDRKHCFHFPFSVIHCWMFRIIKIIQIHQLWLIHAPNHITSTNVVHAIAQIHKHFAKLYPISIRTVIVMRRFCGAHRHGIDHLNCHRQTEILSTGRMAKRERYAPNILGKLYWRMNSL